MVSTPLKKLPNNVGNLGKMIVAPGFEWLPKVQKIAQSGHTGWREGRGSRGNREIYPSKNTEESLLAQPCCL